ncbi:alpha-2-macroglobulin-like protein 1 [Ascaphus truei]|uniref:alpha-2-macroglobulin-like protein 1 n=1 Tax=Ascaphus truei TaxID=8439 RepID=UPI003F59C8A7
MYMLQSSEGESGGSANVELTSYVLLALISGPTVQAEELSKASEIVNWLNKQQNPYGGFSSTQDTVVAIQALAKYTRVTFNDKGNMLVTVQTAMSFQKQFHVDKYNRLLLQREALPDVPGSYSLQVTGIGCVYIQVVLRYNVYPQMEKATFNLSARLEPRECTNQSIRLETLIISVSYTRTRNVSNMVLIEVDMLSGFSPREDTAIELLKMPLVMRVNIQQNSVTIYLDELGHSSQDYSLTLKQDDVVGKLQPANVKVCDYYKPEESSVRTYLPSCP